MKMASRMNLGIWCSTLLSILTLQAFHALHATRAQAIELPTQSCFSISPDGRPELTVFVMEDLQGASARTLKIKFGGLKPKAKSPAEADEYTLPIVETIIKGTLAAYRGTGFTLEIDKSRSDSNQGRTVVGKFDLESSLQVIDPATQKPASYRSKTLSCAKM